MKEFIIQLFSGRNSTFMQVLYSILIIMVFLLMGKIINRIFLKRINGVLYRILWKRILSYFLFILLLLFLIPYWLPSLRTFSAFLGLIGTGILLVNKEIIMNMTGWMYIVIRQPFKIANRIQIGEFNGDVIDIRILETTIMEARKREKGGNSTGRVLHIPNMLFLTMPMANSSKEFMFNWNELEIHLNPDSNWKKAKNILQKIADNHIEKLSMTSNKLKNFHSEYAMFLDNVRSEIYVEMREDHIVLILRYLIEPRNAGKINSYLWENILDSFHGHKDIIFYRK